jgi:hypothetical protein
MIIEKTDIAIICKNDGKSIELFFKDFSENYTNFANNNIIIEFSDGKGEEKQNILLFLQYSKGHRNNGMSFVIVIDGIDIDDIPDEIIIVPTLVEAHDIIEMENIERDLGF